MNAKRKKPRPFNRTVGNPRERCYNLEITKSKGGKNRREI
jgi:hypothetical protein